MKYMKIFASRGLFTLIFIALTGAFNACSNPGCERDSDKTDTGELYPAAINGSSSLQDENKPALARIVFITTSQACACTMERCKSAENILNEAAAQYPEAPVIERIDIAAEKERAMEMIKRHPAMMLPVIYFLDKNENLIQMLDGEILREEVNRVLEKYPGVKK